VVVGPSNRSLQQGPTASVVGPPIFRERVMHLWTISASVTGENKATVIAYFESIVRQMKDNNDDEIAKLRNLIGG
jgi:CRISPR/Cas system CMR subunit Cmr4 (Cas7 group RAMP superfamily)